MRPCLSLFFCRATAVLAPLGVHTVQDLGAWKYAVWAEAILTLAKYENADFTSR